METCFIISSSSIFSLFFIFLFASFTLSSRNDDSRALSSHSSTLFFGLSHAITSSVKDIVPTGLLYKVPPIYYSVVHRRSILHYIYVASGRDSVILNSYVCAWISFSIVMYLKRKFPITLDLKVPFWMSWYQGEPAMLTRGAGAAGGLEKKFYF